MRNNYLIEFFRISSVEDRWDGVDLNIEKPLFAIFFALKYLRPIVARVVTEGVRPNERPPERSMLSLDMGPEGFGASLILLGEDCSTLPMNIVKSGLHLIEDFELIRKYEFSGMQGNPEKLQSRLSRFFTTGFDWDVQKNVVFPKAEEMALARHSED